MTDSKSLFHISQELMELQEIATYDEFTPELENKLAISENELSTKLLGYNHILAKMSGEIETAYAEIERIKTYIDKLLKSDERLRASMLQALLMFGEETGKDGNIRKLRIGTNTFSTSRSKRTIITSNEDVPSKFTKHKITINGIPDEGLATITGILIENGIPYTFSSTTSKTEIKKAIESGEEVDGATIETYYRLVIK